MVLCYEKRRLREADRDEGDDMDGIFCWEGCEGFRRRRGWIVLMYTELWRVLMCVYGFGCAMSKGLFIFSGQGGVLDTHG